VTVRQHSFYLEDDDWTALRHLCLDRGLSVSAFIAQAAREAIAGPEIRSLEASATTAPLVPVVPVAGKSGGEHNVIPRSIIQTATGAPAEIPTNPVRAVPKPTPKAKSKVRVRA
jgi:hypothetical protein